MQYLEHFELERDPFVSGPGVVLATAPLRAAVERTRSDLGVGADIIHIRGKSGIGKTALARVLPAALGREAALAGTALVLDPREDWRKIRASLTEQLELPGGVLSTRSLAAACADARRLVVVIDRAEEAGEEILAHFDVLLAYGSDGESADRSDVPATGLPYFHLVLLSQPDAAGTTPLSLWLSSRRHVALELDPLSAQGVQGYIKQQLLHAGRGAASLFTSDACRAIHRTTGGVPRRVNAVCSGSLEAAARRRYTELGCEFVEHVVARARGAAAPAEVPKAASPTLQIETAGGEIADLENVCDAQRPVVETAAATVPVRRPRPVSKPARAAGVSRTLGLAVLALALAAWTLR